MINVKTVLFVFWALALCCSVNGSESLNIEMTGKCLRLVSKTASEPAYICENDVVFVPPDSNNPLATDSVILLNKHKVVIYPASSVKILKNGFVPLSGRVELSNEDESLPGLKFESRKYVGEYIYGNFKIEVTPDSGTYFAMSGEGYAWIKDRDRKTIEFKRNTELYFPLYGNFTTSRTLSSFWNERPSNFGKIR